MTAFALRCWWCVVASALACVVGVFVGLHIQKPADNARPGMDVAAAAGIRERLGFAGLHPSFLAVNSTDGDTANLTVRVQEYGGPAFQVQATLEYGWHVVHVEPFNGH